MSHNQSSPSLKPLFAVVAVLVSMVSPAMAAHLHQHDPDALAADPRSAERRLAPELAGLGDSHFAVSTENAEAQAFFDQGLLLTYGFNHQEALRAFKEAARLDPELAMAYWGWALVLGPNLNLAMSSEASAQAYEAIQLALDHAAAASDRERALIEALARRYSADPSAERVTLDAAYATAMAEVYEVYSQDADIATLFAAALMNTSPWNYWTPEGRPRRDTERTAGVLERAIERDPHHEGALHYYIHLIESVAPWRGERAADLLRGLAPSAGHLEHMPSHIYSRSGATTKRTRSTFARAKRTRTTSPNASVRGSIRSPTTLTTPTSWSGRPLWRAVKKLRWRLHGRSPRKCPRIATATRGPSSRSSPACRSQ